jgi:hypothetical protein
MKIKIFLFVLLIPSILVAQSRTKTENAKSYKNEIGFNTTRFLSSIFSLNEEIQKEEYALTYKRTNDKIAFRASVGFDLSLSEENGVKSDISSQKIRLGLEKVNPLSSKINFNVGVDVFARNDLDKSSTFLNNGELLKVNIKRFEFGGGPSLRLEYKLADRLVLMTEGMIYASYFLRNRTESTPFIERTTNGTLIKIQEPRSLYISFRF